jgi:hypothetical protein
MSHTHPTASSSSNQASNFQLILINALGVYKKRTKKDILAHPLVIELQSCNPPSAILVVLQQQLQGLDQSRRSDERWTRWLDPTVNVLYSLSGTLERVLVWYASGHALVRDLRTHIHLVGILTSTGDICRSRRPPFSVYPVLFNNVVPVIVILTSLRQQRMFGQAKTLLSMSLSASKCFSAVWMSTQECRQRTR